MTSIPTIDISPLVRLGESCNDSTTEELQCVIDQIKGACQTFGFFAITNHGVYSGIIATAWDASKDFFDCDTATKGSVRMTPTYPYGYENIESLGIERSTSSATDATVSAVEDCLSADSKETFSIGPFNSEKSGMPARQFPVNAPSSFEPALSQYFSSMEKLARILFRGLALALELDDTSWFLREGCFDDGHQCALRILNYPALEYEKETGSKSNQVHIRAGAHTDYGAMTILKSGGPGLQLQLASSSSDETNNTNNSSLWIDVPHLEDAFIINLGDLMQRWTNDRWKSTLHRVIAVADENSDDETENGTFKSARRQSIAFFVNMNGNATIVPFESCVDDERPSRYDAIKASEHLVRRHSQSMGNK